MSELEEAIERVIAGPERKSRVINDDEKKIVAYHESGHTLVAAILPNTDPVHKVSIIARGAAALGYTLQLPTEDKYLSKESEILDTLCVLLAGRAAEEVIFNEISTGAQNDLERVTKLARNLVCKFGMSSLLGPQTFGRQQGNVFLGHDLVQEKEFSEKTAIDIDSEVSRIIKSSYNKAKSLIEENKDKLVLLAKKLEEEEVLEAEQILELLNLKKEDKKGSNEDALITE
jgi:cell division protease FtsH